MLKALQFPREGLSDTAAQPLAFPGAEGFGAHTCGGNGGREIPVTNLNDDGPGSFRAACEAEGPRTAVFQVAGIIDLASNLDITSPYLTIAGETAPGLGVCVRGYAVGILTHDVIVRYLRIRPGNMTGAYVHAVVVMNARNVILDHCSFGWNTNKTCSIYADCSNITIQWCMITESLPYPARKAPGLASLVMAFEGGLTLHHNLWAHHHLRCPRPGTDTQVPAKVGPMIDFRNNVIYNWGRGPAGYTVANERFAMNYIGNYLKPGPSTQQSADPFAFDLIDYGWLKDERVPMWPPLAHIWAEGNCIEGYPEKSADNWQMFRRPAYAGPNDCHAWDPFEVAPVQTDEAAIAYERVLAEAGAALPRRDAVDARIAEEVRSGGGRIIESQEEVGGWPQYDSD